jgi:hypothetical protein
LRKYLFTINTLLFLLLQPGAAQSLRQPLAAIYPGQGAYSTADNDVFAFVNNQAALAQAKHGAAGVYSERRFLLAETGLYIAAIAVPSALGNFGINIKYAGFKNFNENQIGLAYARSLGLLVDIGIQFNYYAYRIPAHNNAGTVNFELGAILHLTSSLNVGIHVYNPVGGHLGNTGEKLSAAYKMGLGYDASPKVFVVAEIVKEEDYPVNINVGLQYRFVKQFFAKAGISTANSTAYGSVGIIWNNFRLEVSGSYHPQLGWSPGFLLMMNFAPVPSR